MKALHLHRGQEAWGHVVARLLEELPFEVAPELVDRAKVLDNFYIPDALRQRAPGGAPFEHYGPLQSEDAIRHARTILEFVRLELARPSESVDAAARRWAESAAPAHPGTLAIGCFRLPTRAGTPASAAHLDLLVVVDERSCRSSSAPSIGRSPACRSPAEALIYTVDEWRRLAEGAAFRPESCSTRRSGCG